MDFKCSIPMQNKLVNSSFSEAEISTLDLKCNSQRDKHISETNKTQIFWATIGNRCDQEFIWKDRRKELLYYVIKLDKSLFES